MFGFRFFPPCCLVNWIVFNFGVSFDFVALYVCVLFFGVVCLGFCCFDGFSGGIDWVGCLLTEV